MDDLVSEATASARPASGRNSTNSSPPKRIASPGWPSSDDFKSFSVEGAAIGLLGIELHTRRRNRANGTIRATTPRCWHVEVDQSFGNCPQYIQLRDFKFARNPLETFATDVEDSTALDDAALAAISAADTFFVASYSDCDGRRQVDVSHRGVFADFATGACCRAAAPCR